MSSPPEQTGTPASGWSRAGQWVSEVARDYLASGSIVTLIVALGGWLVTGLAYTLTEPYAREAVYYDSQQEFPEGADSPALSHIQYEVENPGPGDLEDVKIVVRVSPDDAKLVKADRVYTGYVKLHTNGSRHEFIATTVSQELADPSPLRDGERFGIHLSISKAGWRPEAAFIRQGSSQEIPIEQSPRPLYNLPYWYVIFAGVVLILVTIWATVSRRRFKRVWTEEEGVRIMQRAREHTAKVLSESEKINVPHEDLLDILQKKEGVRSSSV